jgi:hypothetical protein
VESSCECCNESSGSFHKMLGNDLVALQLMASQVVLISIKLVK